MVNKRKQPRDVVAFTDPQEMAFINGDVKLVHTLLNAAQALFNETFHRDGTLRDFLNNTRVIEQALRHDKEFYPYFKDNNESYQHHDQKEQGKQAQHQVNVDDFINEIIANNNNNDSVH